MYGTSWTYLLRSNRCDRHAEWVLHVANTIEIHKFSTMSAYSISVRIRYLSLPFFFFVLSWIIRLGSARERENVSVCVWQRLSGICIAIYLSKWLWRVLSKQYSRFHFKTFFLYPLELIAKRFKFHNMLAALKSEFIHVLIYCTSFCEHFPI